jgi:hypothetical protein
VVLRYICVSFSTVKPYCHAVNSEQVAIKFCFKAGRTATETDEMVCAAYRDEALKQSNIFRWYGWYHDGQEDIHDNLRRGCPSDS